MSLDRVASPDETRETNYPKGEAVATNEDAVANAQAPEEGQYSRVVVLQITHVNPMQWKDQVVEVGDLGWYDDDDEGLEGNELLAVVYLEKYNWGLPPLTGPYFLIPRSHLRAVEGGPWPGWRG